MDIERDIESQKKISVLWLCDLHLDYAEPEMREKFWEKLSCANENCVLIGGDIADGSNAITYLERIGKKTDKPIYFVLGNHDYYGLSIDVQRKRADDLCKKFNNLFYLTHMPFVSLTQSVALVGHDGWADGQDGTFFRSSVVLRDYIEIQDFKGKNLQELFLALQELGKEAADAIVHKLELAFQTHDQAVVVTHPPPFRKLHLYEGNLADDFWTPHFVCKQMGDALLHVMKKYPEKKCLVLAGHTHHEARAEILPNLEVKVTGATYGFPEIHKIFVG